MEPGCPRISHISAHAVHHGGLVLWYGLGRPVIPQNKDPFSCCLDGVSYSG